VITAVDTNVLVDIFGADKTFGQRSAQALRQCIQEGSVYACEVVWAETATVFPNHEAFIKVIEILDIEFSSINKETSLIAANAWRKYRESGGKRERVVADFLIGAHAATQCERFLTRDRGFYRNYFTSLTIIDPSIA
jgi:predicted nucleic acid-binding protein